MLMNRTASQFRFCLSDRRRGVSHRPLCKPYVAVAAGLFLCSFLCQVSWGAGRAKPKERELVVPKRLLYVLNEADGMRFKNPMGVFYDTHHDEVLVADTGNHRVVILDGSAGRTKCSFIHRVQRDDTGKDSLGEPRNLAQNSRGDIFIVDTLCDYVEVCDYQGTSHGKIWLKDYLTPEETPLGLQPRDVKPVAATVDFKDNLYLASACWIFVFDQDLNFQRRLGRKGMASQEFTAISSLWVDTAGKIFVSDSLGYGIRVLSPEGKVLMAFGEHEAGFNNFSMAVGVITDRRGYIWVADALRHIVSIFDANGNFLDYIGSWGDGPGQFAYPSSLGAHWGGRIVVADRVGSRIQCFELEQRPKSVLAKQLTD